MDNLHAFARSSAQFQNKAKMPPIPIQLGALRVAQNFSNKRLTNPQAHGKTHPPSIEKQGRADLPENGLSSNISVSTNIYHSSLKAPPSSQAPVPES